jgi:hypothetical protein
VSSMAGSVGRGATRCEASSDNLVSITRRALRIRFSPSAANEAGLGKSVQEDDGHSTHRRLWPPVQIVARGSSRARLGAPHISSTHQGAETGAATATAARRGRDQRAAWIGDDVWLEARAAPAICPWESACAAGRGSRDFRFHLPTEACARENIRCNFF